MTESGGRRRRRGVRHHARANGGGARGESRGSVAYALLGRGKMADGKGDAAAAAGAGIEASAGAGAGDGAETESMARGPRPASPVPGASGLRPCLWQLETELREQEVSEGSSLNYCRSFCQVRGRLAGLRAEGRGELGERLPGAAAAGAALKGTTSVSRRAPEPGRPSSEAGPLAPSATARLWPQPEQAAPDQTESGGRRWLLEGPCPVWPGCALAGWWERHCLWRD